MLQGFAVSESDLYCHKQIIGSYGIEPLNKADAKKINICPQIKHLCTTPESNVRIVSQYIAQGEENSLRAQIDEIKGDYHALFETMIKINSYANKLGGLLKDKPISSCQILANEVMQIGVEDVVI